MNFAVIDKEINKVVNIIGVEPWTVATLENGADAPIIKSEGLPVNIGDDYNPQDGKFYRDGMVVDEIPPVADQIRQAIDDYTLELINGGIL